MFSQSSPPLFPNQLTLLSSGDLPIPTVPSPQPFMGLAYPMTTDQLSLSLQLYLLMQSQIPQIKDEEKGLKASPTPTVATTVSSSSAFSIDNLLESKSPSVVNDRAESITLPEIIKDEPTVYTLDTLDCNDGRSKEREKRSHGRCVCDECGKSYATASNLSRHKQTHRSIDSPHAKKCPHCDRVYVSMPALSMHLLTHNAQHECKVCGKSFSRLWLLQGHLRSHTGTRPFGCAHCGKFFSDRSNLRAHILTHTGVKKFGCDQCGKKFVLRSYLNRHIETTCRIKRETPST